MRGDVVYSSALHERRCVHSVIGRSTGTFAHGYLIDYSYTRTPQQTSRDTFSITSIIDLMPLFSHTHARTEQKGFYFFILPYMSMMEAWFPKKPTRKCPECKSSVDSKAVRCPNCCIPLDLPPPEKGKTKSASTLAAAQAHLKRVQTAVPCCSCGSSKKTEQERGGTSEE